MKKKLYIGIDNGLCGAIVGIDEEFKIVQKYLMPTVNSGKGKEFDCAGINKLFRFLAENFEIKAVLEASWPRQISGKRQCFKTGEGFGIMKMALAASGVQYIIVSPSKWMNKICEGITAKEKKQKSILFCKQMFPTSNFKASDRCKKDHDGLTDATCMAAYCLMYFRGELK